jgi:hypothetical protein
MRFEVERVLSAGVTLTLRGQLARNVVIAKVDLMTLRLIEVNELRNPFSISLSITQSTISPVSPGEYFVLYCHCCTVKLTTSYLSDLLL